MNNTEAFIAWPSWPHFKTSIKLSIIFFIIFYALFGTTDFIIGLHDYRVHAYFDWELSLPRTTWMSLIYLSLNPMLLLSPFIIRDTQKFKLFFKVLVLETLIASILFLILPMEVAYTYVEPSGYFAQLYIFADTINLTYNELPSLHVTFAFTAAITFSQNAKKSVHIMMFIWASLIAISTLTTHQHHVLGVVSGVLLSVIVLKIVDNKPKAY